MHHRLLTDRHVSALARAHVIPQHQGHASASAAIAAIHGGDLTIPSANLRIRIPRNALPRDTHIVVEAHPELHGFTVTCDPPLDGPLVLPAIVEQAFQTVPDNGVGLALVEVESVGATGLAKGFARVAVMANGTGVARLHHFSGYIYATGWAAGQPCDPDVDGDLCVWVDDD